MKYKCLVLDHDDTLVNSTATIHYPCFLEYLSKIRPGEEKNYTLESYLEKNFHPGVEYLFLTELGMSESEFEEEQRYWSEYVKSHIPKAYQGFREIIEDFKRQGGIVAVASHSYTGYIQRDYRENGIPMPDEIYGWDLPREKRKPSPFALLDLIEKYSLSPNEILVVDDLKPGLDMARGAGADFAAAGWAYGVPLIEASMRESGCVYLSSVEELRTLIFGE